MRKIIYNLRCYACEVLIGWALAIAPKNYEPSVVETAIRVAVEESRGRPM